VRRGYTLIEVVVVLLVLALAAGVVAPSVGRSVDALRARTEVAGLASFLRAAREQAITRETTVEVRLDAETRVLVLQAGPEIRVSKAWSPGLTVEPGQPRTITFSPHGLSSGGQLQIETLGRTVYVVTVDAMTGRVATRWRAS
jgi:general secretion pathway protein H